MTHRCDGRRGSGGFPASVAAAGLWVAVLCPTRGVAVELNLAALNCAEYQRAVLSSTLRGYGADPIDTVMWLSGFSAAKTGERVMYGDALTAFGFALDAECRNNPDMSLLDAVTHVKAKRDNPMDLTRLDCATFETRHIALQKSDPESANTLTMWLFGYATGVAGSHVLDAGALREFDAALTERCATHPQNSLFDALSAPNPAIRAPPAKRLPATKPQGLSR